MKGKRQDSSCFHGRPALMRSVSQAGIEAERKNQAAELYSPIHIHIHIHIHTHAQQRSKQTESHHERTNEQTIRHAISLDQLPDSANPCDALAAAFRHHLAELLYGFSHTNAVCARLGAASTLLFVQHYELLLQAGQCLGTLLAGRGGLGGVGGRWRRRGGLLLRTYGEAGGEALEGGAAGILRRGFCGLVG